MDLNFCFRAVIELTGSSHTRFRPKMLPLFITDALLSVAVMVAVPGATP